MGIPPMVYHFDSGTDNGGNRRMVMGRRLLAVCILASAGAMGISSVISFADTAKPVMNAKAKKGRRHLPTKLRQLP